MQSQIQPLLFRHEGCKLTPYYCSKGRLTIGIGRNLDDNGLSADECAYLDTKGVDYSDIAKTEITEDIAIYLLQRDLEYIERRLPELFTNWEELSGVRQDVLRDMAFNLGIKGLSWFTRMRKAIESDNWVDATFEMLNSKWARDVGNCPGERAYTLAKMMIEDKYPRWVHD
ncbi:glycoside hydrolase family protein [Pseudoalteromonas luteoviolacea]|uniref:glycoside hydrolase family protein n=1 Tax=Pseudoalteromonas luteoviolacea TaxID=43657 RepID=UPI00114FECC0|nr:lysozyme [Pseudoalteromonas luteoviolacea]TQF71781.1 lysozyme [Pseudoalteromonas luteoviolacea]